MYYTTQLPMLVSRQFDDEVIVANFETGLYYSLIGTAADIWLGLKSGSSVENIATMLARFGEQAGVDARQLVTTFVENLLAEKIIAPEAMIPDPQPWSPQFSNPFSAPALARFDDLREVLLVDPVHDVSDSGWPVQAKDG